MNSKQKALRDITGLAKEHHLSTQEIVQALETRPKKPTTETMTKLLAYLGGIFIFAGISIYMGTFWPKMNSLTRVTYVLGTGLILYVLAVILPLHNKKNENLVTPLYLISVFFQTAGLFVAVYEFSRDADIQVSSFLIFGILFTQQILTFLKVRHPVLLFNSLVLGSAFTATGLELLNFSDRTVGLIIGVLLIGLSYRISKTTFRTQVSVWYFVGAVLFFNSFFDLVKNTWFEVLFFVASGALLYLSTVLRNRTLLFVSTVAALGYIGYLSYKYFIDSTTWPIALVLVGLICFGAGITVLKIGKKYT